MSIKTKFSGNKSRLVLLGICVLVILILGISGFWKPLFSLIMKSEKTQAAGPFVNKYYAGAGDGWLWNTVASGSWDSMHNGSAGTSADYTASTFGTSVNQPPAWVEITRGFIPIDTSGLPDNAIITSATLYLYAQSISDSDNDGNDFIAVVQTSQASPTSLITDDFDQAGAVHNPIEGSNRVDLTGISTSAYTALTLNSTALGWISKTGYTRLGIREGHDILDNVPNGFNRGRFYSSEQTGTSQDPYLEVTYTVPPTHVYYSVGQNTANHKTGSPTVTISSGVATFSEAQTAPNMGVGDRVTYGASLKVWISGKISQTQWRVVTVKGAVPADVTNSTVTSIVHEFSSLRAAASGSVNSSHLNTSNLVTGNYVLNIPCYYDSGPDTQAVLFDASPNTGPENYIKVYTPTDTTTEVNQSQRHSGKWDNSKYRLEVSGDAIQSFLSNVWIEGLQISAHNGGGITMGSVWPAGGTERISYNIIRDAGAAILLGDMDSSITIKIHNNILYDLIIAGDPYTYGIYSINTNYAKVYAYNNTVQNTKRAFQNNSQGIFLLKNNIAQDCGPCYGQDRPFDPSSVNNISQDNTSPNAGFIEKTVQFVDRANDDFHLASTDTAAKNLGVDLSADPIIPFSNDIDGETRPYGPAWDVGADETYAVPILSCADNTSAWAWSDNIGWIHTGGGGANYGVNIDPVSGDLSGYAWSDNIGWISFNRSDAGNPPSAPFNSGSGPIANVNPSSSKITGWIRVLSTCDSVPCTSSGAGSQAGGWDGWIRFCDASTPNCSADSQIVKIVNNNWQGWAWSDKVVGWISFNCLTGGNCGDIDYKVSRCSNVFPTVFDLSGGTFDYCSASESPSNIILAWEFNDPGDSQTLFEIQVKKNGGTTFDKIYSSSAQSITAYTINQDAEALGLGSQFIWYDPAGEVTQNYDWRIKVWDSNSASSPWSDWANFTILPNAFPDGTINRNILNPSVGETVTLQNSPGVANASWSWSINPEDFNYQNGTDASFQNPQVIFDERGPYTISLTVTDNAHECSCTTSISLNLRVALPGWRETVP